MLLLSQSKLLTEQLALLIEGITLPDSTPDRILLRDLPQDKEVELLIPHSDVSNFHSMVSGE